MNLLSKSVAFFLPAHHREIMEKGSSQSPWHVHLVQRSILGAGRAQEDSLQNTSQGKCKEDIKILNVIPSYPFVDYEGF